MPSTAQTPLDISNTTTHTTAAALSPVTRRASLPIRIATAVLVAIMAASLALVLTPPTPAKAATIPLAAKYHPRLKYGKSDPAVKYIKKRLGRDGSTSGYYGRAIERLVNKWRKAHGMSQSGVVGERMWDKLGVPFLPKPGTYRWAKRVMAKARAEKGDPYRYGADGPNAFDCSGFTMYIMGKMGINLPHSASDQRRSSHVFSISKSERRRGDLVFVPSGSGASHVGIYAGNGAWWESPRTGLWVLKRDIWTSNVTYGRLKY